MRTTILALTVLSGLALSACDDGGTTGSIDSTAPADPNAVVIEPATPETPADPTAPATE